MAQQLTKEALDILSGNTDLQIEVAKVLKISIHSMPNTIKRNSSRLIEYPSIKLIGEFSGKPLDELIEEVDEPAEHK